MGVWECERVGELPNSQFPQHSSVKSVKSLTVRVAELTSRIKFQKELEFACEF